MQSVNFVQAYTLGGRRQIAWPAGSLGLTIREYSAKKLLVAREIYATHSDTPNSSAEKKRTSENHDQARGRFVDSTQGPGLLGI